jgi:very-short-patch-repair endonuclease
VAVELDGERYHSTPEQREHDRRRDVALASIDWVTLRYSHARLHGDVAGCRRDTLRTLAVRHPRFAA